MKNKIDKTSKFLSYILRHKPEEIGLTLSQEGWADIDELIVSDNKRGESLSRELIDQVVFM